MDLRNCSMAVTRTRAQPSLCSIFYYACLSIGPAAASMSLSRPNNARNGTACTPGAMSSLRTLHVGHYHPTGDECTKCQRVGLCACVENDPVRNVMGKVAENETRFTSMPALWGQRGRIISDYGRKEEISISSSRSHLD